MVNLVSSNLQQSVAVSCYICSKNIINPINPSLKFPLRRPNQPHQSPSSILSQPIKPLTITTQKNSTSSVSDIIRLMDSLGQPITPEIYSSLIKECIFTSDSSEAIRLHSRLINFELTPQLIRLLLLMHLTCGQLDIAHNMFDKMPQRKKDFLSWAIIIIGYFDYSYYKEATVLFAKMLLQHNVYSIMFKYEFPIWVVLTVCIVKACAYSLNIKLGKQVHGLLLKFGGTNNISINVSLIDFYGKVGCLKSSNLAFNGLHNRSTAIWTSKMVNHCRVGYFHEVTEDFVEMGRNGVRRNGYTFSSVLKACGRINDNGNFGKQVHAMAIKLGLESDEFVECGLIAMYGKSGMCREAKRMFEAIDDKRNAAYWNAMLMSYVRNGLFIEAIKLLYQMEAAGIQVKKSLLDHVRIACGTDHTWEEQNP